jgi:hypothetical protein
MAEELLLKILPRDPARILLTQARLMYGQHELAIV